MEESRFRQLTLRIPEDLHRELKIKAAREGRNMGHILEDLIRTYVGITPEQGEEPEKSFEEEKTVSPDVGAQEFSKGDKVKILSGKYQDENGEILSFAADKNKWRVKVASGKVTAYFPNQIERI